MDGAILRCDPSDRGALLGAIAALPGAAPLLAAVAASDAPAHLVGGATRDLLLGRAPRELDVVVDGDPEPLLAALGGVRTSHERFGTATVELAGGVTVDVARARAEHYPRPGALPEVEWAPLAIDLHRRDVTINAIAIDLRSGALSTAGPAIEDLTAVRLRVLHPASFSDDPTRLWRLVRYEVRLGADWEPVTLALARRALAEGCLSTVTPERIARELRLALREPDPYGVLAAAERLGLPPRFELDAARHDQALRLGADAAPHELALASFAGPDPELDALLDRREERALIAAARGLAQPEGFGRRPGPLPADAPGSQLARRFDALPAAAVAAAPDGGAAARWLGELRHVTLAIDGDDLLAAGVPAGPALGEALTAVRDAVLDGRLGADDRPGQLALARDHAC